MAVLPYFIAAILCGILVGSLFRPWERDMSVPFDSRGDAYFHEMLAKNFVETGHYYVNPLLGAPGRQELYDFPLPHWTHVMVWSVLRLFTHNWGLMLNLYYLLTYPLTVFTALYALRRLGVSTGMAIAGALLYSIFPFHLLRREAHLFIGTLYTQPLACLVVIWVAMGNPLFRFELPADASSRPLITRDGFIAIIACVLTAWDYPYYPFFTASLVLIAGLLGTFRYSHRRTLITAVLMCAVLTGALLAGLLPNLVYFHYHGRTTVGQRVPVESETYAITLIQLLAPVESHRLHALAHWTKYYHDNAVLVNETWTDSLGFLGVVGFFITLASLFRKRCSEFLYSLGILNLWALLLGTIGGFGAVFAFTISPQIRSYNRICVFIGFFSIAAVIWALDSWLRRHSSTSGLVSLVLVPTLLVTIGILDQVPRHFLPSGKVTEREFNEQAGFIAQIQNSVPPHSMIFQLPYMSFPEHGPLNRMIDYDQLMPYLHSDSLRWSYGAMRERDTARWIAAVSAEPTDQMVSSVAAAGFAGIYVDRFGYADNGTSTETQLRAALKTEPIQDVTGRYLFFRMNPAR